MVVVDYGLPSKKKAKFYDETTTATVETVSKLYKGPTKELLLLFFYYLVLAVLTTLPY